jgi:Carboxypeptidase regulatory-like domain
MPREGPIHTPNKFHPHSARTLRSEGPLYVAQIEERFLTALGMTFRRLKRHSPAATAIVASVTLLLVFSSLAQAQSQNSDTAQAATSFSLAELGLPQHTYGAIRGKVVDQNGDAVVGAQVKLIGDQQSVLQQVQCDENGQFAFDHVPPGAYQLTIEAQGFKPQTISRAVTAGGNSVVPQITLSLAMQVTEVTVRPPTVEIAQEQVKDEEHQRILGIIPNFYVTYKDAAPLNARQKFHLALKATTDPAVYVGVGVIAAMDQAGDRFSGFGQGAEGYAKRYGASFANLNSGLWLGGAVIPSLIKQDPRYFYNGTGSKRSRFLYAVSRTFICKGDNQRWQPNYSSVGGDFAAAALSTTYIPTNNRGGLIVENAGIALAATASINVLEEFLLQRVTSHKRN